MKNKMLKAIIAIFYFFIFQSCSTLKHLNNDLLLIDNIYIASKKPMNEIELNNKEKLENFIIYELSYLIIGSPSYLPRSRTQYLFIPRYDSTNIDSISYFELFRYSNYDEVIKFKDISGDELSILMKYINNVRYYSGLECDIGNEHNLNFEFRFFIKIDDFQETSSALDLWEKNYKIRSQYLCLQAYLNSLLFIRELDYYGNRRFYE